MTSNNISEIEIKKLEEIAYELRVSVIKMLTHAKSGHPGSALGMADIFAALYFHFLNIDPKNPTDENRDRLILSSGHICPILYASLAKKGFFPEEELFTLRQINSRLQGHPHNLSLSGVENSSGPLGQGISVGAGIALSAKIKKQKYYTFIIGSDGELNEGQSWEASLFMNMYQIPRLIWIVDKNNIQIDGFTKNILDTNSLKDKFKAFNFEVFEIDGNNMKEICMTISKSLVIINKPVIILANTVPGKGVDFMEYKFEWHGKAPNKDEEKQALNSLKKMYQYEKK